MVLTNKKTRLNNVVLTPFTFHCRWLIVGAPYCFDNGVKEFGWVVSGVRRWRGGGGRLDAEVHP